jgi:hypothetical protein
MTTNLVFTMFLCAIATVGTAFWLALVGRHRKLEQQRLGIRNDRALHLSGTEQQAATIFRREKAKSALRRFAESAKRATKRFYRISWRRLLSSPSLRASR